MAFAPILRSSASRISYESVQKLQCLAILSSKQYRIIHCQSCQNVRRMISFISAGPVLQHSKVLKTQQISRNQSTSGDEVAPSIGKKISNAFQYIGWLATRSSILQLRARKIYGYCTDSVDYKEIFKVCNMPDTFQSWFLVIHLHIWMCYVRLNSLGDDGQTVNRKLAELMWEDIRERLGKLGIEDTKARKEGFKELSKQFYGLTITYNKAFMAENEKEFPDALRRNLFYNQENPSKQNLHLLLQYIDKQFTMLDNMTKEELLGNGKIEWIPLSDVLH